MTPIELAFQFVESAAIALLLFAIILAALLPSLWKRRVHKRPHPGLFVVLESAEEGAGKTTLAISLEERLRGMGHDVLRVREPGGTTFGERIRSALLDPDLERSPRADLFAMNTARAALVDMVIRPALEAGGIVICDRFTMSSLAYQGAAGGLGFDYVREVCDLATQGLHPDVTLFLRLSPEEAERRRKKDNRTGDYFEHEQFLAKARDGYTRAAQEDPSVALIDATQSQEEVVREALNILSPHLHTAPEPRTVQKNRGAPR